jgi:hypothetical protein
MRQRGAVIAMAAAYFPNTFEAASHALASYAVSPSSVSPAAALKNTLKFRVRKGITYERTLCFIGAKRVFGHLSKNLNSLL